jgi:integrase
MAWTEKIGERSWRVRYRCADGDVESIYGFDSAKAAQDYADMVECDRRRGVWLDPSGFKTTVAEWVDRWFPTLDLDTRTLENYRSYLRNHILPEFGDTPLGAITTLDVRMWIKQALEDGYAQTTVSGWLNLLSMIFTDAVDQRLIPANPIHKRRRRGRRSRTLRPERIWATPAQVLRVADQAGMLGGPTARLLVITAGWTGCRWGELTGLHRRNVDLHRGVITIDQYLGALHESTGKRWVGPPKTASSARRIALPPFLVDLLREHLATHPYEYVFTTRNGTWLWRSTFDRRVFRPAADGNLDQANPKVRTTPACPGLTFHGLRHSHNTWMITDDTPEIARSRRLGHHLDNRLVETYSHVSGPMQQQLLTNLEHRWRIATGEADPDADLDSVAPSTVDATGGMPAAGVDHAAGTVPPPAPAAHRRDDTDGDTQSRRRIGADDDAPNDDRGNADHGTTGMDDDAVSCWLRAPRHARAAVRDQNDASHHHPPQIHHPDHQHNGAAGEAFSFDIQWSDLPPDDSATGPCREDGETA